MGNPVKIERLNAQIEQTIASLREIKGNQEKMLQMLDEYLAASEDHAVLLKFEKVLLYQHLYMIERDKQSPNEKKMEKYINDMKESILEAGKFIKENKLNRWSARLARFYGRYYDYRKEYGKSLIQYRKALKFYQEDPEYAVKKVPRNLELQGFLSYSLYMTGKKSEGLSLARDTFKQFDDTEEGKKLKRTDYTTWAIWKSGIPIRILQSVKKLAQKERNILYKLLNKAEEALNPPQGIRTWTDFQYRKDEIAAIKRGKI